MNNRMTGVSLMTALLMLAGCTSSQVQPLRVATERICVLENPKVLVDDFVEVVREGFSRHGITTQVYQQIPHAQCPYVLTYSALRSWDFAPYLSVAELTILGPQRQKVASAQYRLRGKGGLSLMKWQGTRSKIAPLIDELLAQAPATDTPAPKAAGAAEPAANGPSTEEQLRALSREPLDYQEYQRRYRALTQPLP